MNNSYEFANKWLADSRGGVVIGLSPAGLAGSLLEFPEDATYRWLSPEVPDENTLNAKLKSTPTVLLGKTTDLILEDSRHSIE